jgi:hypothetical protein
MATVELDIIKQQSKKLVPKQKLELIEYLSKSLTPIKYGGKQRLIEFGKYQNTGLKTSTDTDFNIAEWHPTEAELNGD